MNPLGLCRYGDVGRSQELGGELKVGNVVKLEEEETKWQ